MLAVYFQFRFVKIVKTIAIDNQKYTYTQFKQSLPGQFLFTPRNFGDDQSYGRLVSLSTSGAVNFFRKISTKSKNMTYDFKLNSLGQYSYFLIESNFHHWGRRDLATVGFYQLDKNFSILASSKYIQPSSNLDPHDVIINKNGNFIFIYYNKSKSTGLIEAEIKEVNLDKGPVFSWMTVDHFKSEKLSSKRSDSDYLHANSICEDTDGGLIISFNEIGTVIKLGYPTGEIKWEISKKNWTFLDDDQNGFSFQHAAQVLPNGHLLMYDNAGASLNDVSRAVEYELDFAKKTARLVWQQKAELPFVRRNSWGSVQRIKNGNTLISWGSSEVEWQAKYFSGMPIFTEYDQKHNKVRELISESGQVTYRAHFSESPEMK